MSKSKNSQHKLIGISGRAQAGKSTLANHLKKTLDVNVQIYSFADSLKKDVCIKVLGLAYDNIYGSNEDKDKLTYLKWQNMPGVCTDKSLYDTFCDDSKEYIAYHEPGFMTNREVMEFVGTGLFRKMYEDCWIDATFRIAETTGSDTGTTISIIEDVRSPNEVDAIQSRGGKVIRLTRDPLMRTSTIERNLDSDKFDWSKFDLVIQNKSMSLSEKNKLAATFIREQYENNETQSLCV